MEKRNKSRAEAGVEAERRAGRPSIQSMLELPLLRALEDAGGSARPRDLYERLAADLGLDPSVRDAKRSYKTRSYSAFDHTVRWTRQNLVMQGLVGGETRGRWDLVDAGYRKLGKIRRGAAVLIYRMEDGLGLWAHAEDAASLIEPSSCSLIMLSPPYPSVKRAYGVYTVEEWLAWMSRLIGMWKGLLRPDGTLAINIGDVHVRGAPTLSVYPERMIIDAIDRHGYHLAGRAPWHSPTKLANMEWALKRRVTLKNSVEHVVLLTPSSNPDWDADQVPRDPSAKRTAASIDRDSARGSVIRPSGYNIDAEAFAPRPEGRVPSNLIVAGGAGGNSRYDRRCREMGIAAHPAKFPEAVPRRIIQLTTRKGATVHDPMAGSSVTGKVALEEGRRFIGSEPCLDYAWPSSFRFEERPGFVMERPDLNPAHMPARGGRA